MQLLLSEAKISFQRSNILFSLKCVRPLYVSGKVQTWVLFLPFLECHRALNFLSLFYPYFHSVFSQELFFVPILGVPEIVTMCIVCMHSLSNYKNLKLYNSVILSFSEFVDLNSILGCSHHDALSLGPSVFVVWLTLKNSWYI